MVDLTNVVNMSMYDLSTSISDGYDSIAVYTSSAKDGVFTEVTTSATRVTLLSTTEYYMYLHTDSDISDNWYKFKLFNGTASASSFQTSAFKSNTSDLTEDLRYMIEDTSSSIANYRYTIKELRRMIKMACYQLQQTPYRNRFKADVYGIISPVPNDMDKGIILLQGQIEVIKSQLIKQADTNISYSDGSGKFNNRSSEALRDILKLLKIERNELIHSYNRVAGNDSVRCAIFTSTSGVST